MAREAITPEDRHDAARLALAGIANGGDVDELVAAMARLRRRHTVFPGDVVIELAADALDEAGFSRDAPLEFADIRERFLPEIEFRGNTDHQKSHYALRAAAMIHGGVKPDLAGDVGWWRAEDFYAFAFYALLICLRAAADRTGESVPKLVDRIGSKRGIDLAERAETP